MSEQRPRRRGLMIGLIIVGLVVVITIAAVIAESLARQQATALITSQVRQALALEADHPVEVVIGGPPILMQAAGGRLESVRVEVPRFAVGELVGDLTVHVADTPIDPSQVTDELHAEYRISEVDVAALAGFFSGIVVTDVQLDDGEVRFETGFEIFGFAVALGLGVEPTVMNGQLAFTPRSFVLNDQRVEAADLRALLGGLVEPLLATQQVCVAQYLPRALNVADVDVSDTQLVVVFAAENVALSGDGFSTRGTCP